ncbi:MAG: hypothetical protein CSA66_01775 [Proteobacteria bacterium]|nr:MAG: hypothetical protein CSA66_01775 [Pseudomonadota bacterium]
MKLSVSTKIFLGFAVVIIAFGSTFAYALYQLSTLRRSVTVIWKEVIPISNQLEGLGRQLQAAEELFGLERPSDARWLQQVLPTIEPFDGPQGIGVAVDRLRVLTGDGSALAEADRVTLVAIAADLDRFFTGRELVDAIAGEDLGDLADIRDPLANDALYDALVRRTLKKASVGELTQLSPEVRASVRVFRRVNRLVGDAVRRLSTPIQQIDKRAQAEERSTTLAVVIIASGALLISLLMLFVAQLTLRPIRALRAGAKRVAAGRYDERVQVSSGDELGQLADEFNRMAASLEAREELLERQREELLRAERLAVIGKLAAQITHEVRNPLSSIGLNAELLEEELEDLEDAGEARESLGAIIREVQRLKSITEEYLHFARLPKPDLGSVDVGALLTQFLSFLSHEVREAGISLTAQGLVASLEGGPPPIEADADQLRQALLNIARNAIEALRDAPAPRRIEVTLSPRPGGGVRVRIADNGAGIDPEVADRLFEPFVTGKSHGTGLGLALTREIIHEHGGTITPVSPVADGRGTAFIIDLPQDAGRRT